jgi:hypothetical protein
LMTLVGGGVSIEQCASAGADSLLLLELDL